MTVFQRYFLWYLLFINLVGILAVCWDKLVAVKGWNNLPRRGFLWISRVPEKNFFVIALLGGSVGTYLAMRLIRHKTLHRSFMIGIPLIFLVEAALVAAGFLLL